MRDNNHSANRAGLSRYYGTLLLYGRHVFPWEGLGRVDYAVRIFYIRRVFPGLNEETGELEFFDTDLPFNWWSEGLPYCSKALHEKGSPSDLDMADIIDIKHFIIRRRIPELVEFAKKVVKRNPQVTYFYYAIGVGADNTEGLQAVKKGLKAKQTTPFVRGYLLYRTVEHAGTMGVPMLTTASAGEQEYVEGIAFLTSALEDTRSFIEEAPPNARHLITILNWYNIITLVLRGPEISSDLHQMVVRIPELSLSSPLIHFPSPQGMILKLKITCLYADYIGYTYEKTLLNLTRELIMQHYSSAAADFGSYIARRFIYRRRRWG